MRPVGSAFENFLVRVAIAAVAVLIYPLSAQSESWVRYGSTDDGATHYFDTESVREDGAYQTVWARIDWPELRYYSLKRAYYNEELHRFAFDCRANTYALIAFIYRVRTPKLLEIIHGDTIEQARWSFGESKPGSVAQNLLRAVCVAQSAKGAPPPAPIRRVAEAARSASWELVHSYQSGQSGNTTIHLDTRSIKKTAGLVTAILKTTYGSAPSNQEHRYKLTEIVFDCPGRRSALSAYVYLSANNDVVSQEDIPPAQMQFTEFDSSSVAQKTFARVCAGVVASTTTAPPRDTSSFGTGWLAESGHVITAYHVIENATAIEG